MHELYKECFQDGEAIAATVGVYIIEGSRYITD